MDSTAPIIVVGAGRSGTTRLSLALGEHPDVYMINETSFLLPRLWQAFHERPEYVRTIRLARLAREARPEWRAMPFWTFYQEELPGNPDTLGPLLHDLDEVETSRLQRAFGAFLAETLIPPTLRTARWGFKEIWAGSDSFPYDWQLHRAAFPNATYVHSVRHPIDWLRSYISNSGAPAPNDAEAIYALGQWVKMVDHARTLRGTGRFIEFRMEDFDAELSRVLSELALDAAPACVGAAALTYLPSASRPIPVSEAVLDGVPGLRELADAFGYSLVGNAAETMAHA